MVELRGTRHTQGNAMKNCNAFDTEQVGIAIRMSSRVRQCLYEIYYIKSTFFKVIICLLNCTIGNFNNT